MTMADGNWLRTAEYKMWGQGLGYNTYRHMQNPPVHRSAQIQVTHPALQMNIMLLFIDDPTAAHDTLVTGEGGHRHAHVQ